MRLSSFSASAICPFASLSLALRKGWELARQPARSQRGESTRPTTCERELDTPSPGSAVSQPPCGNSLPARPSQHAGVWDGTCGLRPRW